MSVELRWNEPYGVIATLSGGYSVDDVAYALEDAFPRGTKVGPLLILDLRRSLQDHGPAELERLASLLCARCSTIWIRTGDVLRYGFARELMAFCNAKNVTVRIEHQDPE